MSSFRPELHVAQQLRRDKLRVQNSSQHLQEFPSNLEQLSLHPGFNLDLLQVRNVRNGNMLDDAAALYSSEMITFSSPSNPLSTPRNPIECQELMMAQYGSRDQQCEPRNLGANWVVNYNNNNNNNNAFLPSDMNSNVSSEIVNREIHKQLVELQYPPSSSSSSPPIYHNALQDMAYGVWGGNTFHHPSYENQVNNNDELRFGGSSSTNLWTNSTTTNTQLGFKKINELHDTSNPHQGLSLSLSSNSQSNSKPCVSHFDEGSASDKIPTMKMNVPSNNNTVYRSVGPLGPFTGYATILKSSRFLKPCQQLLDEWCCESGSKFSTGGVNDVVPEWVSRDVRAASTSDVVVAAKGGANSGASSSVLYGSNQNNNNINISNNINNSADGGAASSFCISSRPECQKNKAKLLYMQEEVIRRYKQYHQQMQMVVQSFESVAGLSSATPFVSLALKSVSKHFRSLKNAISDQLKFTCEVLGEDLSIPTTSTSSKFDNNMARLRCMDQSDKKNKTAGGSNINFFEPQQHVWRPQRGLPERSVAILKAWLFEHFLHPYPTDTDKHMLATQTGLSRNQVSNWFINARVRVWKPMVEEIHMLETKGAATEAHQTSDQGISASEGSNQPKGDHHHPASRFGLLASHAITEKQFQCLEMGSSSSAGNDDHIGMDEEEQWNQEKRSKLECQMSTTTTTPSMDGTMMGFMPYRRGGGLDGLSSVSLTLGLRHGVEGVQQQQLQQEEELRRQFGGHMIHDFVG